MRQTRTSTSQHGSISEGAGRQASRRQRNVCFPPIADNSFCWLVAAVKRETLICIAALTGCTSQREVGCPAIEKLAHRDAAADAGYALAKGDKHLLMLGGYVGSVPGVQNSDGFPTEVIAGTSDVRTEACAQQRATAEAYAAKYNQVIVQGAGR
jgi:hypothetical protein